MPRPGAMTTEQFLSHLLTQAEDISRTIIKAEEMGLPPREDPLAYVGAIGIPMIDWALSELPHANKNYPIRIALETIRGTLIGIAETY